jgi:hypothetical protein
MLEGVLLLLFGLMGYRLNELHRLFVPGTVALLSFIMGMLLQAKVKNDPEILRDLAPSIFQLIGAVVPA